MKTGKPTNNLVLLKPRMENDRIKLNGGGELFVDTSFELEKHANIVADVIEVPDSLFYVPTGHYSSMPWDTDMEILPGDVAYCDYLPVVNAIKNQYDGKAFFRDGELHLLIKYDGIFMVLRNGLPIMLNGYVLVEPTYDEYWKARKRIEGAGLEVPQSLEELKNNTQYGTIRYVGSRPRDYFGEEVADLDLSVGDKVLFGKHADIPLENELHQTFQKGTRLFRVNRKDIMMVL